MYRSRSVREGCGVMDVVLDTVRELVRQDFAGADEALLVAPQKSVRWDVNMRHVIECP